MKNKDIVLFEKYKYDSQIKLDNFEKYVRGQRLSRFLARYELFKKVLNTSGSIVECGVHYGGGLLAWAKLSNALEPYNYKRKIIGFDSFSGFPTITKEDIIAQKENPEIKEGGFSIESNVFDEIIDSINEFENSKTIKVGSAIEIIKGNAVETIPKFLEENTHTIISILFLDFDLFEPTVIALENFLPLMPKKSIIAFDEINDSKWPGETQALLKKCDLNKFKLQHFSIYPALSYIVL
jgi:hypothetical protein